MKSLSLSTALVIWSLSSISPTIIRAQDNTSAKTQQTIIDSEARKQAEEFIAKAGKMPKISEKDILAVKIDNLRIIKASSLLRARNIISMQSALNEHANDNTTDKAKLLNEFIAFQKALETAKKDLQKDWNMLQSYGEGIEGYSDTKEKLLDEAVRVYQIELPEKK